MSRSLVPKGRNYVRVSNPLVECAHMMEISLFLSVANECWWSSSWFTEFDQLCMIPSMLGLVFPKIWINCSLNLLPFAERQRGNGWIITAFSGCNQKHSQHFRVLDSLAECAYMVASLSFCCYRVPVSIIVVHRIWQMWMTLSILWLHILDVGINWLFCGLNLHLFEER